MFWLSRLDVLSNEVLDLNSFSDESRCFSDSDSVTAMREGEHFSFDSDGVVIGYISC